ncbi:uncharacterized protein [Coffea arabica]|uniref:Uncharacterized protein n=1 Tax=Coffea arabica TaxID=13443 RepID=A0ABM4U1Q6_COFAR
MTADKARLTYARVCVEIEVDDELLDSVEFVGEDDKWVSQPIVYEWRPQRCNHCKALGHSPHECALAPKGPSLPTPELSHTNPPKTFNSKANKSLLTTSPHGLALETLTHQTTDSLPLKPHITSPSMPLPSTTLPQKACLISSDNRFASLAHLENSDIPCTQGNDSNLTSHAPPGNLHPPPSQDAIALQSHEHISVTKVCDEMSSIVDSPMDPLVTKEHGISEKNADRIVRVIGPYLDKLDNYACHQNGRIWVFWDPSKASVKTIKLSSQFVHTEIVDKQSSLSLLATFVYASNSIDERECLWHDLVQLNVDSNCSWIALGDFNTILKMDEKIGGLMVNPRDRSFGNCLFDCGLDDLK